MKPTINYSRYVDELIDMMYSGDCQPIFGSRARQIGKELVAAGGGKALFTCMEMLTDELSSEYSSEYLGSLRELEFCWNGLDDSFQA